MNCPYCRMSDTRVLDSRVIDDGTAIRRRRLCNACERRFTTLEQMQLVVLKRSGVVESFSRDKVIAGVRKACKGRPVSEADLAKLGQRVEEDLRGSGLAEVPTDDVGVAILGPLSELDPVAYLRFASVYRHYQSVEDFVAEIGRMREPEPGDGPPGSPPDQATDTPPPPTEETAQLQLTLEDSVTG